MCNGIECNFLDGPAKIANCFFSFPYCSCTTYFLFTLFGPLADLAAIHTLKGKDDQ